MIFSREGPKPNRCPDLFLADRLRLLAPGFTCSIRDAPRPELRARRLLVIPLPPTLDQDGQKHRSQSYFERHFYILLGAHKALSGCKIGIFIGVKINIC